ncbi:hypothetical protein GRF29_8g2773435 [Pseudopithomyces chartarum]|uniref:Heterokaryon incompatibility domain-containing protein n=1 Tax=Pseudopithomyces chartarum TaxID=1892770 RepID=A0AAN6M4K4_9PLEO|nr:hypothetical protein GRF29_8g2773435 [Pseudopithomyces chartarum]
MNAGSDDTFDFARKCIEKCLTNANHGACVLPKKSAMSTPKRLVDVGRAAAPIRLIDTQGKALEYTALSHCWGTGSPLKTTKANWKKLSYNIPFESLPPLFQDAILITRQLGLRYIWIDSLCIIQDSARDWETESFRMGNIYENSYVTISATGSSDGGVRCLRDRERPVKLTYTSSTAIDPEIRAARIEDHHPHGLNDKPAELLGPLTTRAWALQEHVLSTRVLHYTNTELLFECRTSFRCECSPSRTSRPTTPALIPKAILAIDKHPNAIWDAWHRVVEQFSRRNLTVQMDKLPAVSGIAGKIQKATSSKYLAGLWESNFAFDLLWSTSTIALPDAHYFSLSSYRAPTFSWASLDTPVTYSSFDDDDRRSAVPSITLVSSSVSVNGLNPLGSLRSVSASVLGPTLHATLLSTQKEGVWEYALHIKGTSVITIQHDCLLTEDFVGTTSHTRKTVRRAQCGNIPQKFKAPVFCLGVVRFDTWMSGLVLGLARHDPGCWNRLGTFAAGTDVFLRASEEEIQIA